MNMSIVALILIAILCVNGDRTRAARYYRQQQQRPRGQMGFKWTRQYSQGPSGGGFGSSSYGYESYESYGSYGSPGGKEGGYGASYVPSSTTEQPEFDTTENDATTTTTTSTTESFTETTEATAAAPTLTTEGDDEESTAQPVIIMTPEGEDSSTTEEIADVELVQNENEDNQHQPAIMDCLYNNCTESFYACFNDEQCKTWMEEWQKDKSLKPECLPNYQPPSTPEMPETTQAPEEEINEDVTFETTSDITVEPTANTEYNENTENTETTENIENNGNTETTETPEEEVSSTIVIEEPTTTCSYNELFWNVYNCGVENYCYANQTALAQSHQYLVSPSNYRVPANVAGSTKSSSHSFDFTLLWVAMTSGIAAIVLFEVTRRLYKGIKQKCQCQCKCGCASLCNSFRYLRNKLDKIRGYHRYEKTHEDLDAIEEEDDAEKYGSNQEESMTKDTDTIGVTYNGPLNDSDVSDDEELQKGSSSRAMSLDAQTDEENNNGIDDQFVHSDTGNDNENEAGSNLIEDELMINKDENNNNNNTVSTDEQKDKEETIVEEPIQQL